VAAPEAFQDETSEILRRASVALGGAAVRVWEVLGTDHIAARASTSGAAPSDAESRELQSLLKNWGVPATKGSRWVACHPPTGPWIIAPVRNRAPAPPPGGRERRSRERLTLELAGLCLGLVDRRDRPSSPPSTLQDLAGLPAMIAHEAGNPLTAARAGLQLVLETLRAPGAPLAHKRDEVREELTQVLEDIDRAVSFLRAVQDRARGAFTRIERFDVVRVIRSCLTLEKRLLQNRKVTLAFETTLDSAYLTGDPNSMFELVVNLVRNAADAYEGRSGKIEVSLARTEERVQLRVSDTGQGIQPQDLPFIFEPGFTTKEFGKGSGMGLALVRSVTQEIFAGSVHVDSEPGQGTTFTVSLPVPPQRLGDPQASR
jgi:signal transduction histidine kinase